MQLLPINLPLCPDILFYLLYKLQHLGLPLDLMKSIVMDESLSMLNQSSVFENLLKVCYAISTE